MSRAITISQKGDYKKTTKFLNKLKQKKFLQHLDEYGIKGVKALQEYTPTRTGATAMAWDYQIVHERGRTRLIWTNDNAPQGVQVALLIQYGHAARNGAWVEGIDYINPALQSVFKGIAKSVWEEVTNV